MKRGNLPKNCYRKHITPMTAKTDSEFLTEDVLEFGDTVKKKIEVRKFKKTTMATGTIDKNKFAIFGEVLDKKKKMGNAPADDDNLEVNLQQFRKLRHVRHVDTEHDVSSNLQVDLHTYKGVKKQDQHLTRNDPQRALRHHPNELEKGDEKRENMKDDDVRTGLGSNKRTGVMEDINLETRDKKEFNQSGMSNARRKEKKIAIENETSLSVQNIKNDQMESLKKLLPADDETINRPDSDNRHLPEYPGAEHVVSVNKDSVRICPTKASGVIDEGKDDISTGKLARLSKDFDKDRVETGPGKANSIAPMGDIKPIVESSAIQQDKNSRNEAVSNEDQALTNKKVKEAVQILKSKKIVKDNVLEYRKARLGSAKLLQPIKSVSKNQTDLVDEELESKVLEGVDLGDDWLKPTAQSFEKNRSNSVDIQRKTSAILNGLEVKMNNDLTDTDIRAVLETQVRDLYSDGERKKPLKLRTSLKEKQSMNNHNGKVKKILRSRSKSRSSDSTPPLSPTIITPEPLLPTFVENSSEGLSSTENKSNNSFERRAEGDDLGVSSDYPGQTKECKGASNVMNDEVKRKQDQIKVELSRKTNNVMQNSDVIDRSESLSKESRIDDHAIPISKSKLNRNKRRMKDDKMLDRILLTTPQAKHSSSTKPTSLNADQGNTNNKHRDSEDAHYDLSKVKAGNNATKTSDINTKGPAASPNSWWLLAVGNQLSTVESNNENERSYSKNKRNYNELVLVEITEEQKRVSSDQWILIARGLEHDSQTVKKEGWVSVAQGCDSLENGSTSIEKYKQWSMESEKFAPLAERLSKTRKLWDQTYMPISDVEIFTTKEYSILDGTFVNLKARRKPVYIKQDQHSPNCYKTYCIRSQHVETRHKSKRLEKLLFTE